MSLDIVRPLVIDDIMAPKKSVFRASDAQHFQLVHRSLRDPLINDPEASDRVFKPVERGNDRQKVRPITCHQLWRSRNLISVSQLILSDAADAYKGYTLADLEAYIDKSSLRANEGEAALYGITYDDSSYDYMSHLRPLQGGSESVLIAGPQGSGVARGVKADRKGKGKAREQDLFIPQDFLASKDEVSLEEVYGRGENIPVELQGLQPDMDPHLRQVLEALEDDAFVGDEEEGQRTDKRKTDFWGELIDGGEADEEDREDYAFQEWGVEEDSRQDVGKQADEETWQDRFKAFKQAKDRSGDDSDEEVDKSEMADTVGSLASNLDDMMVKGGKKRRGKRGPSDATGMSMSSSSMFRNQGLRDLDTRFDKVRQRPSLELAGRSRSTD